MLTAAIPVDQLTFFRDVLIYSLQIHPMKCLSVSFFRSVYGRSKRLRGGSRRELLWNDTGHPVMSSLHQISVHLVVHISVHATTLCAWGVDGGQDVEPCPGALAGTQLEDLNHSHLFDWLHLQGLSYYKPWGPPPLKIWQNSFGPVRAPRHETNSFYYKMSTLSKGWQINTSIKSFVRFLYTRKIPKCFISFSTMMRQCAK